jgi:membrane protein implicated in regulation of membrane protease activity
MMALVLATVSVMAQAPESAEAPSDSMTRNLLWMVPVAIVLVFLIRRRRKKRVKVGEE